MASNSRQLGGLLHELLLGKPTADPATAITGSLLSGAMLAAGAIVEMGENANGSYWRWEGGLQVCVSPVLVATLVQSDRAEVTWIYPASYLHTPTVIPARHGGISSPMYRDGIPGAITSQTECRLRALSADSIFTSELALNVWAVSVGRWK